MCTCMIYYPVNVPDIVELYPAANNPSANIISEFLPNVEISTSPALTNVSS